MESSTIRIKLDQPLPCPDCGLPGDKLTEVIMRRVKVRDRRKVWATSKPDTNPNIVVDRLLTMVVSLPNNPSMGIPADVWDEMDVGDYDKIVDSLGKQQSSESEIPQMPS